MFISVIQVDIKPDRWQEASVTFGARVLPPLEHEPGFLRVLLTGDAATCKWVLLIMWRSEQYAQDYQQSGEADKLLQPCAEMFATVPETVAYPVLLDREF